MFDTTATKTPAQYLEHFAEFEKRAAGGELRWLRQLRREAFARFCEIGFPTTHDEDWRFTNVAAIANTAFRPAPADSTVSNAEQVRATIENAKVDGASCRLVFLNGRFAPEFSSSSPAAGVTADSLAQALVRNRSLLEQHLGHYEGAQRDGFSALNMAFAEDGAFVRIARGVVLEEPIHLLFVSTLDEAPILSNPRNLLLADENSQASIVEEYMWLGNGTGLCNAVTEVVAGDGAVLSHFRASHQATPHQLTTVDVEHHAAYHVSTLRMQQGRSANVASHSVLLGGTLVRNNVHPVLAGEGGECLINGLFLCTGSEHIDNYMLVEHRSPHCGSRQFYNGILDGHSRGVFHGRIIVHPDAQKTDAKQTNRNLLLSDDAQIDTKPQLEIHADDVKCTHGATIGQIEEDALFYLRSRGIEEDAARKLLLLAFADECIARMQEGVARQHLEALVQQHLLGFSSGRSMQEQRRG